jgi:hypothetical protein
MSVVVDLGAILTTAGRQGGRTSVKITMYTDTATDGSGPYVYASAPVFVDVGASPPTITGPVTLAPSTGLSVLRTLSGLTYYTNGTQFTLAAAGLNGINANAARPTGNLNIGSSAAGISAFDQSPLPGGAGAGAFTGWTAMYNMNNAAYSKSDATLNRANYRQITKTATAAAILRDPWGTSAVGLSPAVSLLIDTYGITSTDLAEYFDDESRRQDSTYNNGTSVGNWSSSTTLTDGQALVYNGKLQVPNTSKLSDGTLNTNWTSFKPDGNPNYTGLGAPAAYHRTLVDTSGLDRSSIQIVFSGTFVVSAVSDLAAGLMVIRLRRRASANGGQAGIAADPLYLSGPLYDFATFDDGVTDGHIREAASSGNTVNGTFGGFVCNTGVFLEIVLMDARISLDSFTAVFF